MEITSGFEIFQKKYWDDLNPNMDWIKGLLTLRPRVLYFPRKYGGYLWVYTCIFHLYLCKHVRMSREGFWWSNWSEFQYFYQYNCTLFWVVQKHICKNRIIMYLFELIKSRVKGNIKYFEPNINTISKTVIKMRNIQSNKWCINNFLYEYNFSIEN